MDHQAAGIRPNNPITSFHRRRPIFWLALAFCAGIAADGFLAPGLSVLGGICLAAFLGGMPVLLFSSGGSARSRLIAALCLGIAGGALTHALRARIAPPDDISRRTSALPSFVYLRGTLVGVELRKAQDNASELANWTLAVEAMGAEENTLSDASGRVHLNLSLGENPAAAELHEGANIQFRARVEAPPELTLPDSFDYAAYLERQNIRRSGTIFPGSLRVILESASWWRVDLRLRALSAAFAERVESSLAGWKVADHKPGSQAALLNALLFGRREHVDIIDRDAFAITGVAHLLVIAGLHIQFLAWMVWRITLFFNVPRRKAAFIVLLFSVCYCALAGASPPILRATVMIVLYLLALLFYREADPLSVLGAAALSILFFAPAELFNAGFQLSFLSVLALATLCPAFEDAWETWKQSGRPVLPIEEPESYWRTRLLRYMRTSLFITLAAWLATAPVVAWHMGRFATLSLLVNLLAVPLASLCMVSGLAMLVASILPVMIATVAVAIAFGTLAALQGFVSLMSSLPGASIELPAPTWPLLIIYAGSLAFVWIERRRAMTLGRVALVSASCLIALNAGVFFREPPSAASITILDINHGRSALVESPGGGAALVDSGAAGDGLRIAEVLRRRGISRLALLAITADESEAVDGAVELLKRIPAQYVILPRASSASASRRDLEKFLTTEHIAYDSPDLSKPLHGPGDVRWDFCDDGAPAGEKASTQSALCIRVSMSGSSRDRVVFLAARSNASLQRLKVNLRVRETIAGDDMLKASVIRVSSGMGGAWPADLSDLVAHADCQTLVAGTRSDPEESTGLDLAMLSQQRSLRLLWPHRDGSLRIQADVGVRTAQTLQAYKNGKWQEIP